jgi:hypothetical protein
MTKMYITKISPEVNDKIIAIKIFASPGSVDRNIVSFFANDELKFTSPGYNIFSYFIIALNTIIEITGNDPLLNRIDFYMKCCKCVMVKMSNLVKYV